jgi:fatty-acid peroxygenase
MDTMPSDTAFDSSLALLTEGYEFIPKRCARHGSDVCATRLLFEPTIRLRGAEAAELFADTDRD